MQEYRVQADQLQLLQFQRQFLSLLTVLPIVFWRQLFLDSAVETIYKN